MSQLSTSKWWNLWASVVVAAGMLAGALSLPSWGETEPPGRTTIVVHLGSYKSVPQMARSEAWIPWLGDDKASEMICTHSFVAMELQRYLRRMTGRQGDFAITNDLSDPGGALLLVGGPQVNRLAEPLAGPLGITAEALAPLGAQGYRLVSEVVAGRRMTIIAGGSRIGTLYGAYDLLHHMGCRWFAPGDLHEVVPSATSIPDLDITEKPAYISRGFFEFTDLGDEDFLLWMARNRLNHWCADQSNHPFLRKLGFELAYGDHTILLLCLNPRIDYPYQHAAFERDGDASRTADPYPVNEHYVGDRNGNGQLSNGEAHPEWFPLIDGKRMSDPNTDDVLDKLNFCTSNPEACQEFVGNCVRHLTEGTHADLDLFRLWTFDMGRWCTCETCEGLGTATDRLLLLMYHLDKGIKRAQAEGKRRRPLPIRTLAYWETHPGPTRPLPDDFDYDTCSVTFFPIHRCYWHNINDAVCTGLNRSWHAYLKEWTVDPDRHYRGRLCIGEYYNITFGLPVCFMHSMANDIPYYHDLGADAFHYMHPVRGNWGNKALTNWQMARQSWDPETDIEDLWEDYFSRRYGSASATMRRFYESLEKMLSNIQYLGRGAGGGTAALMDRGVARTEDVYTDHHLRFHSEPGMENHGPTLVEIVGHRHTCRRLIDRALAAPEDPSIRRRIEEDEQFFSCGERVVGYLFELAQAFRQGRAGRLEEARYHYQQASELATKLLGDTTTPAGSFWGDNYTALHLTAAPRALGVLDTWLNELEQAAQLVPAAND